VSLLRTSIDRSQLALLTTLVVSDLNVRLKTLTGGSFKDVKRQNGKRSSEDSSKTLNDMPSKDVNDDTVPRR
jgi:hypothetical protein